MRLKLLAGLVILFIALSFQFLLASAGVFLDLSFAALIASAFIFDFWELLILVLLGVFILNWQPAESIEILVFGFFPLAVFFSRNIFRWKRWAGNLIAIFIGFLLLYLATSPHLLFSHWLAFLTDVIGGMIFGGLIFLLLQGP